MNRKISGKKVIVFGGTGFIGSLLVIILCRISCHVDIVTRSNIRQPQYFLGNEPGQVKVLKIDEFNNKNLNKILQKADMVFNLIGILFEAKKNSFNKIHVEIPKKIAESAKKNDVRNFIHLSALNVDKTTSSFYSMSKLNGEEEVKENFPNCVIVRPSVVFGKRDGFTNLFSDMSKFSPFLPLIGTPEIKKKGFFQTINFKVRFQPIYVRSVTFLLKTCLSKKKTFDLLVQQSNLFLKFLTSFLK